jgi:cytochrome c biogenesis protein CcmG/thiol:disulfide interchange protein DsbE
MTGLWWWAAPMLVHVGAHAVPESHAGDSRLAPDFSLKDANGRTVRLSDYRGRVVLLNFWATWCSPCNIEIPWFVEFQSKYKAGGLTVLGVSMDDDGWKVVRPFLAARNINYPILLGNDNVARLYGGIESLPLTLLIGRDGRTEYYHPGLISRNEYQTEILELLRQKNDATRISHRPAASAFAPFLRASSVSR